VMRGSNVGSQPVKLETAMDKIVLEEDFLALAAETARRPDRYAGFAHLAMQDVKAAIAEL
jgi:predicted TIM-barrel fold metal-dependent hydrolase